MHLHCIGMSHQTAKIAIRERLAFSDDEILAALPQLLSMGQRGSGEILEAVILSTCNRVELYVVSTSDVMDQLEVFLSLSYGLSSEDIRGNYYRLEDEAVIRHLFRVASGLDSLVIGEPQILGQVAHALDLSKRQKAAGKILVKMFEYALITGKRVRTETSIGRNPTTVASMAILLVNQVIHDLSKANVLVVGAGEMAESAIAALCKRDIPKIRVINRTLSRAQHLASRFGGEARTFADLKNSLSWADIVIASTASKNMIIQKQLVEQESVNRAERALVLIDISVPRNIDPEVSGLPGVYLYDIDTLKEYVEVFLHRRKEEIPQAQKIVAQSMSEFSEYLEMLNVFPLIAALHQRAEEIRQVELEKTIRRIPDLDHKQREIMDRLTKALVKKILNPPTSQLRSMAGRPELEEYASLARSLFGLDASGFGS